MNFLCKILSFPKFIFTIITTFRVREYFPLSTDTALTRDFSMAAGTMMLTAAQSTELSRYTYRTPSCPT